MPLHFHRVVGRRTVPTVGAADEKIGKANPMPGKINRQAATDDHLRTGGHGPHAGIDLFRARVVRLCSKIDGPKIDSPKIDWPKIDWPKIDDLSHAGVDQPVEHRLVELRAAVE